MDTPLLRIPEVADRLKVSRETVYRLIREDGLPAVVIGDRMRVDPAALAAWVASRALVGADREGE